MKTNSISNADVSFFETVARAAFANPFGETRDQLDRRIGGAAPDSSGPEIIQSVTERVHSRIQEMKSKGSADLRSYQGEQQELIRRVFLFYIFHRYVDLFDALIQAQSKSGDTPCKADFADKALVEFNSFGFSESDGIRYFAVFYQLRRAYYFIRNGLVGNAASMRSLRKHIWNCVFTHDISWFEARLWNQMEDFSILLLGETGTGKGSAAAAIGRSGEYSGQFRQAFRSISGHHSDLIRAPSTG